MEDAAKQKLQLIIKNLKLRTKRFCIIVGLMVDRFDGNKCTSFITIKPIHHEANNDTKHFCP
jgi:hypothetical protein